MGLVPLVICQALELWPGMGEGNETGVKEGKRPASGTSTGTLPESALEAPTPLLPSESFLARCTSADGEHDSSLAFSFCWEYRVLNVSVEFVVIVD